MAPTERTFAVAELAGDLARLLAGAFPTEIWVHGQLRNLKRSANGHVYFDLAEPCALGAKPAALLPVTLFDGDRRNVNAMLKRSANGMRMVDGVEARIRGRLQWYGPGGRLTLRMTTIDPTYTLGRLSEDRERLLAALDHEGLLHRNSLLPLPPVPLRVGLVTSVGSAAHADFLTELTASDLGWRVTVVDTRTQGQAAPTSVGAALRQLAGHGVDVIALVRGGGSRTDLAPFDSEVVARTIAGLNRPVVTGIGHEIDTAVADLVAHTCSKTPTACAAELVERVQQFVIDVEGAWTAVAARSERRLDETEQRVSATARQVPRSTRGALALQRSVCGHAAGRLDRSATVATARAASQLDRSRLELANSGRRPLERVTHLLATAEAVVRGADPARALARGWSLTRKADGSLIRHTADLAAGDAVITTVADGDFTSRVMPSPEPTIDQTADRHGS